MILLMRTIAIKEYILESVDWMVQTLIYNNNNYYDTFGAFDYYRFSVDNQFLLLCMHDRGRDCF